VYKPHIVCFWLQFVFVVVGEAYLGSDNECHE